MCHNCDEMIAPEDRVCAECATARSAKVGERTINAKGGERGRRGTWSHFTAALGVGSILHSFEFTPVERTDIGTNAGAGTKHVGFPWVFRLFFLARPGS